MAVGAPDLVSTFIKHGLVDEFRLYVHPVVLGDGKPMFSIQEKLELEFVKNKTFPGDVVMLKYSLTM